MPKNIVYDTVKETIYDTVELFKTIPFPDTIRVVEIVNDTIHLAKTSEQIDYIPIIITAGIGIVALLLSFFTFHSNQKHQKLSSEPFLNVKYCFIAKTGIFVSLVNEGLGPAIVQSFEYTAKNATRVLHDGVNLGIPLRAFLNELIEIDQNIHITAFTQGAYIAKGDSAELLRIDKFDISEDMARRIKELVKEIDFIVYYNSVYDKNIKQNKMRSTRSFKKILSELEGD